MNKNKDKLKVVLTTPYIDTDKINKIEPGMCIVLDHKIDDLLVIYKDNKKFAKGYPVILEDRVAIRIVNKIGKVGK